ncbi:MAG TPA: glycerate kinase [Saprospiraceae bacterium]|nr:glycerate kinase [Saprospiraceae bacterium]
MKKILIAPDSFKEALSAREVCAAIKDGIKKGDPFSECTLFPLSDGGEGVMEVLNFHLKGKIRNLEVQDSLGRKIHAQYALLRDNKTAVIEMAQAAGLQLLSSAERNPLKTSTFGVGQLIENAIQNGVEKILLCIGGSATNDAGAGMAAALGFKFFDKNGGAISPSGENLALIESIEKPETDIFKTEIKVRVLCDVENPLYGPAGAAAVYAPQKGADENAVRILDEGLRHFSKVLKKHFGKDFSNFPGAGAAGGMGAGAMAFLNAVLCPGIQTIMEMTGFENALKKTDLVITGEGKVDAQTFSGKLVSGVATLARKYDKPVVVFCGRSTITPQEMQKMALQKVISVTPDGMNLAEALARTKEHLQHAAQKFAAE